MKDNKEIIQRILECTLWGHLPYESMDILKEQDLETKCEICEELLVQSLKIKKQMDKVIFACNATLESISATDKDGKRFRYSDVQVPARYELMKDFINNIVNQVGNCTLDPDTISEVVLYIPYIIDQNDYYNMTDPLQISDIKYALEDLWLVQEVQPVYKKDTKEISQFICKCKMDFFVDKEEKKEESISKPMPLDSTKMIINKIQSYVQDISTNIGFDDKSIVREINDVFNPIITALLLSHEHRSSEVYFYGESKSYDIIFELCYSFPTATALDNYIGEKLTIIDGLFISISSDKQPIISNRVIGKCDFFKCKLTIRADIEKIYKDYRKNLSVDQIDRLFSYIVTEKERSYD